MLLLESIKLQNKTLQNIEYHNARFNSSRADLFNIHETLKLEELIIIPDNLTNEIYKCRVSYSDTIKIIEFEKYSPKAVNSLKVIVCNEIDYNYKYADRSKINELYSRREDCDDILIVKNGLVTDTSFANIVFWDGDKWLTPSTPLFKGTARARLLDQQKIFESEIRRDDLSRFAKARIINAMIGLEEGLDIIDFHKK